MRLGSHVRPSSLSRKCGIDHPADLRVIVNPHYLKREFVRIRVEVWTVASNPRARVTDGGEKRNGFIRRGWQETDLRVLSQRHLVQKRTLVVARTHVTVPALRLPLYETNSGGHLRIRFPLRYATIQPGLREVNPHVE